MTPAGRRHRLSDRWWTVVSPGYDRAVGLVGWHRWLDTLVADLGSGRVLEVGCGPAHPAPRLLARGVDYVGLDRNAAMLARAARRTGCGPGTAALVRADVTALPFADDAFDVVLAAGVLGLLDCDSRRAALQEMARVARTEVRLLEPVHRPGTPQRRMRSHLLALVRDRPLELAELVACGLEPRLCGPPLLAGVYSAVCAMKPRGRNRPLVTD
ncbi:hypothetical protein GCM10009841_15020 [Microlunatus panaciterrae]|uniref:Ubiquinone/menaquinone biosynthesis C-methylase UbiE n=1 Tax=Microlunatus panaciterrae TaxID=400768 RepID=A0ABS2RNJ5_9ACTN|nr:class I SAM-dependent methyltransferase [Microlunatus panaciterrae]MBM7800062.1 ubiquinone/menaquinone biosynthesis C-methylase UbiE [Microlunatus panaciterrae]